VSALPSARARVRSQAARASPCGSRERSVRAALPHWPRARPRARAPTRAPVSRRPWRRRPSGKITHSTRRPSATRDPDRPGPDISRWACRIVRWLELARDSSARRRDCMPHGHTGLPAFRTRYAAPRARQTVGWAWYGLPGNRVPCSSQRHGSTSGARCCLGFTPCWARARSVPSSRACVLPIYRATEDRRP
jgi:hypothetical protein